MSFGSFSIYHKLLSILIYYFSVIRYINELIEYALLAIKDGSISTKEVGSDQSTAEGAHHYDSAERKYLSLNQEINMTLEKADDQIARSSNYTKSKEEPLQPHPTDWARILEAATQRRTEVLAPENLENMWTKGRNYKKKESKTAAKAVQESTVKVSGSNIGISTGHLGNEISTNMPVISMATEKRYTGLTRRTSFDTPLTNESKNETQCSQNPYRESSVEGGLGVDGFMDEGNLSAIVNKGRIKRSNSTSALKVEPNIKDTFSEGRGPIISEFYNPDFNRPRDQYMGKSASDVVVHTVGQHLPKLRCRVSILSGQIMMCSSQLRQMSYMVILCNMQLNVQAQKG